MCTALACQDTGKDDHPLPATRHMPTRPESQHWAGTGHVAPKTPRRKSSM